MDIITEIFDFLFSKKKKMERKYSANEKRLFHGTSYDVADAICFQNFDFRLCGKNATMYGKGSYFSTSARYSHNYSEPDSKGCYYMFIAQVLVGRHTAVNDYSDFIENFCFTFLKKPCYICIVLITN